tara:strand:- start:1607 stop:2209 length:603 start_codon:yes stop_codon:yes gene_type:complete
MFNSEMDTGYQVNNLNAGHHLNVEELNELHPLWSKELKNSGYSVKPRRVSFCKETMCRDEEYGDIKEKTDFLERGNRPLCKALKVIEAAIYERPIYNIFLGEKSKFIYNAVDIIIDDILESLVKGIPYRFNNASSTRVKPSSIAIEKIKTAHLKFKYFAGLPLSKTPPIHKVSQIQIPKNTSLVRQVSRSVYCCPKIEQT